MRLDLEVLLTDRLAIRSCSGLMDFQGMALPLQRLRRLQYAATRRRGQRHKPSYSGPVRPVIRRRIGDPDPPPDLLRRGYPRDAFSDCMSALTSSTGLRGSRAGRVLK